MQQRCQTHSNERLQLSWSLSARPSARATKVGAHSSLVFEQRHPVFPRINNLHRQQSYGCAPSKLSRNEQRSGQLSQAELTIIIYFGNSDDRTAVHFKAYPSERIITSLLAVQYGGEQPTSINSVFFGEGSNAPNTSKRRIPAHQARSRILVEEFQKEYKKGRGER